MSDTLDKIGRENQLLTANELSEWLGVNLPRVYQLAKAGKIPGTVRIERTWRFRVKDLLSFIADGGSLKKTGI